MAVIPQPKLPPEAMPWAREITKRLQGVQVVTERAERDSINVNKQINSTAEALVQVTKAQDVVGTAQEELKQSMTELDTDLQQINEELALPITDAKLLAGSLSVWPFQESTIPAGALEQGAVGSTDIADFAITAKKFNDNRHHIF